MMEGCSQQVIKLNLNTNSSTGDFTRRKNWSQSILESLRDVVHVLSSDLCFVYCSAASSEFLGYKPTELVNRVFTDFLHVDDVDMFVREFRSTKNSVQVLRSCYRFLRKDGKYTTLETRGRFYKNSFFGTARKVPTETSQSIDLFLDLKMENEMLKKKLAQLKQRETREGSESSNDSRSKPASRASLTTGGGEESNDNSSDKFDDFSASTNNPPNVYTQGVSSSYDINESLALFTGLRYDLGERSVGISLGLENSDLTTVGMEELLSYPIIVHNMENEVNNTQSTTQTRLGKKKRVEKPSETKICTDCGTTEAPEWRKGPNGPKTLCNACGLRWSKTQKKLEQKE
ncbi:MAG: MADB protein [Benjaminiella poitrasii]|nr:MAG: MADB protein [Benjaminiella poitrasii]